MTRLEALEAQGFDRSSQVEDDPPRYRVRCSQCEALVINGVACHETGCVNAAKARREEEQDE